MTKKKSEVLSETLVKHCEDLAWHMCVMDMKTYEAVNIMNTVLKTFAHHKAMKAREDAREEGAKDD